MPIVSETEVVTNDAPKRAIPQINYPVALNWQTTLQSPFFWIIAGMALGIYLCRTNKF